MKLFGVLLIAFLFAHLNAEQEVKKEYFQTPTVPDNAYLALYIDKGDLNNRLIVSKAKKEGTNEKFDGEWKIDVPPTSAVEGDDALILTNKAKHHAISIKLARPLRFDTNDVVIQYEVKFEEGQECGGAYIKLLTSTPESQDLTQFNDKTPFTIMFGPDKCGNDQKLHFIFRHKNPKSGKFEEKAMTKTYSDIGKVFSDHLTHLLTLMLHTDNTFEILLDKSVIISGSLLSDFQPPVVPPKQIADENDKKPDDWDDRDKIVDPTAHKPEDWDETAPEFITDVNAEKPVGWLDNEPNEIPDPTALQPDDWDKDIDGEWEAARIANPKCSVGCGPWEAPKIHNPAYKGKWQAPMIDNPNYRGKWEPRMIDNPHYFEDNHPYKMAEVSALGLELWSMSSGIVFDNFFISDSKESADRWASETWKIKNKAEKAARVTSQSVVDYVVDQWNERPAVVISITIGCLFVFFLFCYFMCCRSSGSEAAEEAAYLRRKKDDDYTSTTPLVSNDRNVDMDADESDQQYEAAGPAALRKQASNVSQMSQRSSSSSPVRGQNGFTQHGNDNVNGGDSDAEAEDVRVEAKKSEQKVSKRKARKD